MDGQGVEEYYRKYIALQERLQRSEEERLQLEMQFNNMIQVTQEEERMYFKRLKSQYKRFMEEHRRRQERNAQILHLLERIESRAAALEAKSKRFKLLRHQHRAFLNRVEQGRKLPSAENVRDSSPSGKMSLNPDIDPPVFRPARTSELIGRRMRDLRRANELLPQDEVQTLAKESLGRVVIEDDTDDSTTSNIPMQNGFKHNDSEEDEKVQRTSLVTCQDEQELVDAQNGSLRNVDINQNSLETVEPPRIETIVENSEVKNVPAKTQIEPIRIDGNKEETGLVTYHTEHEVVDAQNGDINQNSLQTVEPPRIETIVENSEVKNVPAKTQIEPIRINANKEETDLVTYHAEHEVVDAQNGGLGNGDINQNSLQTVEPPRIETIVENSEIKNVSANIQMEPIRIDENKEENGAEDVVLMSPEGDVNNTPTTNDEMMMKEIETADDIQEENDVIVEQIDNECIEETQSQEERAEQNGEIEVTNDKLDNSKTDYQENNAGIMEEVTENEQNITEMENTIDYDQTYQNQEYYDNNAQNEYDEQPNDPNEPEMYYDENGQPIRYAANDQQEEYKYDAQYDENGQPIGYDPNYQDYQYDDNGLIVDYSQGGGQGAGQQVVNYDQTGYEQPATDGDNPNAYYDENGQMLTYDYQGHEGGEGVDAPVQEVDLQPPLEDVIEAQPEAANVLDLLDTESASSRNAPDDESDFDLSAARG